MQLSAAAKVGFVTIVAAIIFIAILANFGSLGFDKGDKYTIIFQNVGGLQVKAPVLLAGVRIGSVYKIALGSDDSRRLADSRVKVTILVNKEGVRLYRNRTAETAKTDPNAFYVYTVAGNLLGDKWLDIRTGRIPPAGENPVKPNGTDQPLIGEAPVSIDDLAREGYEVMGEFRRSVTALNNLVADEKFQSDIRQSVGNFAAISSNLKGASQDARGLLNHLRERVERLSNSVELVVSHVDQTVTGLQTDAHAVSSDLRDVSSGARQILAQNRGKINEIVSNLHQTSIALNKTIASLQGVAGDKGMKTNLTAAVRNLNKTSQELQGIASDIRSVTSDPEVQSDLRDTIHNAKEASEGAKKAMKSVNGAINGVTHGKLIQGYLEEEWDARNGRAVTNGNVWLLPYSSYSAKLGVDSIGERNLLNLQAAKNFGDFSLRAGIVRSKVGVGADARFFHRRLELSADVYNTRKVHIDVTGRVLFPKDVYLLGGYRGAGDHGEPGYPIIGAGKRF